MTRDTGAEAAGLARFRRERARRLRHGATDPERILWRALERLPLQGTHFRRQVPIGPYVADFACLAARLVIELDGAQHGNDRNVVRDRTRQAWLEAEGYRVIRFWNAEIADNLEGVLDTIYAALHGDLVVETQPFTHRRRSRSTQSTRSNRVPSGEMGEAPAQEHEG